MEDEIYAKRVMKCERERES